ncbi:hypothetical protein CDD83_6038 [Cordyceps sp. RAO-2017]|nr:hypothetical protein CDD83_6038 [Cordyceps sp. RAO-2017]
MAFLPKDLYKRTSFAPLFRLLEDFDSYARQDDGQRPTAWQPKFDLHETEKNYELYGELPGINKENVHIEFIQPQTLLVSGKVERTRSTSKYEGPTSEGESSKKLPKGSDERGTKAETHQPTSDTAHESSPSGDIKYWLTERSIGEFSRSFNFPSPVDHDSIAAKFKDGVLNIVVPKARKHESRRIVIT